MQTKIQEQLFFDPEQAPPLGLCPVCGGELYSRDGICLRCERGEAP